jgi:hypothetical protein
MGEIVETVVVLIVGGDVIGGRVFFGVGFL